METLLQREERAARVEHEITTAPFLMTRPVQSWQHNFLLEIARNAITEFCLTIFVGYGIFHL